MKADTVIASAPGQATTYRFSWIFSFSLAIVAAPFVVFYKQSAPWLIVVPIALGAAVILAYEFWIAFGRSRDSGMLVSIPSGYKGTMNYDQLLALEIHPKKRVPKEQLQLFPGFEETTASTSVRIIADESGKEIAVVSCNRFSALRITYLLDNMDKATEKSLRAGLSRFGQMAPGQSDVQLFVHDKTVREAIKADFRGNLVTLVSKGGEKVIKDLLKTLEERAATERKTDPAAKT